MKTLFLAVVLGLALLGSGLSKVLAAFSHLAAEHQVDIHAAMKLGDVGNLAGSDAADDDQ